MWDFQMLTDRFIGNLSRNRSEHLGSYNLLPYWYLALQTWSMLQHTHVLRKVFYSDVPLHNCSNSVLCSEFLGVNELDNRPFIVMPYLKNGNAQDYVQSHPDCDLLPIVRTFFPLSRPCLIHILQVHHILLGLVYLHSRKAVHGDLKAVNVFDRLFIVFH